MDDQPNPAEIELAWRTREARAIPEAPARYFTLGYPSGALYGIVAVNQRRFLDACDWLGIRPYSRGVVWIKTPFDVFKLDRGGSILFRGPFPRNYKTIAETAAAWCRIPELDRLVEK